MADYKLWNALKDAKKYRWVELSHALNNERPPLRRDGGGHQGL